MKPAKLLGWLGLALWLHCGISAAADKQTVLVVGGGQSGQPTARILAQQGYDVRVMVRDPSRASGLPASAMVVAGDATRPESLSMAFDGVDYVISTIGSPCTPFEPFPEGSSPEDVDYRGVANLVDAAKRTGTLQLVLMSSLGAGIDDPADSLNRMCGMVLAWKGKGEEYLRASGVPYTIVRPGGLRPAPGEEPCTEGDEPLRMYPGAETGGAGNTCRGDVGLVMIDALGNEDALGKTVNVILDTSGSLAIDDWRAVWAEIPRDQPDHAADH
jgi:uncharacterized protein YbjT (DUF2867 family)